MLASRLAGSVGVCWVIDRWLNLSSDIWVHVALWEGVWPALEHSCCSTLFAGLSGRGGNLQTSIFVGNSDFVGTLTLLLFLPVLRCLGHNYCLYPCSGVYELCVSWLKDRDRGIVVSRLTFFEGECSVSC